MPKPNGRQYGNDICKFIYFRNYFAPGQAVIWTTDRLDLLIFISLTHLLIHWSRVTHICARKLNTIGLPGRRQSIIWTSARILSIGPLWANVSEILTKMYIFAFRKIHLKILSGKICLGLNVPGLYPFHVSEYKSFLKQISLNKAVITFFWWAVETEGQYLGWKQIFSCSIQFFSNHLNYNTQRHVNVYGESGILSYYFSCTCRKSNPLVRSISCAMFRWPRESGVLDIQKMHPINHRGLKFATM